VNHPEALQQDLNNALSLAIPAKYPCPFLPMDLEQISFFLLGDWEENNLVPSSSSDFTSNPQMSLKNPLLILTFFSVRSYLTDLQQFQKELSTLSNINQTSPLANP